MPRWFVTIDVCVLIFFSRPAENPVGVLFARHQQRHGTTLSTRCRRPDYRLDRDKNKSVETRANKRYGMNGRPRRLCASYGHGDSVDFRGRFELTDV